MKAGNMTGEPKDVIWLTGLSGAGKTTIAIELVQLIKDMNLPVVLLDGDLMREAMSDPNYGYDKNSRIQGAYRYSRFAKMFSDQGLIVVVSTISMYHEVRDFNRKNLSHYYEVFIHADEETRKKRDPKKLYQTNQSMVGDQTDLELPINPNLTIHNHLVAPEPKFQAQLILTNWMNKCVE